MMGKRGAFGRGQGVGDAVWDWRWFFVVLVALAVLGRLAEALGLI